MLCHAVLCHAMLCHAHHQALPSPPQVLLTAEETPPLSLANLDGTRTVGTGARFSSPRELLFDTFHTLPRDVYYWVLPAPFTGDKVPAPGEGTKVTRRHPRAWLSLPASRPRR